jgi:Dockerin type I domain/PEP-CTERM motif
MNRINWFAALVATLVIACSTRQTLAVTDDFTLGDFENLQYVGDQGNNYNTTVSAGEINNGGTPDAVTATSSAPSFPTNQDYPPAGYTIPTAYPNLPGGTTQTYGNWNQINNTGFGDWGFNSTAIFSNSTTTGVTKGTTAIEMNPNLFGGSVQSGNYTQHLAIKVQDIGQVPAGNTQLTRDTTTSDLDYANIQSHKYLAIDVTFKSSDWTHGTFANTGTAGTPNAPGAASVYAYINAGYVGGAGPLIDRTGFQNLGQYVANPSTPTTGINRPADVDSRQALLGGTAGVYDPGNHTGTYTTTLYWDYSHWQAPPSSNPGDPASGMFYDLRQFFSNTTNTSGSNGYTEFMFATGYDNGYTAGDFYFDNMRVTNTELRLGDFNQDGHIDMNDISAAESALTNPTAYEASHDGMSAADMLTVGDINGDGKFNGADIQALIADLKAGKGSVATVPEPASFVLLGLAVPGLAFAVRRRKHGRC